MASATTPPGNPTSSSPSSRSCGACASCAEPRRCNLIGSRRTYALPPGPVRHRIRGRAPASRFLARAVARAGGPVPPRSGGGDPPRAGGLRRHSESGLGPAEHPAQPAASARNAPPARHRGPPSANARPPALPPPPSPFARPAAHLRESLERHRDLLQADAWIFCDGPIHQSRRMQVVYGARGVVPLELTVYGPSRALHDGNYGNWAPNPAALLASLLSSMRDPDGRVTIAGFYDGVRPVSDLERKAIAEIPDVDAELRRAVGPAHTEAGGPPPPQRNPPP